MILDELRDNPAREDLDFALEQATLGAMLIAGRLPARVSTRCFADRRHQAIFATAAELEADGEPIDPLTVALRAEKTGRLAAIGSRSYLSALEDLIPDASSIDAYGRELAARSLIRLARGLAATA